MEQQRPEYFLVACTTEQDQQRYPGVRDLADDFAEYLQFLHNGNVEDARNAWTQILRAFSNPRNYGLNRPPTQDERNTFGRQLVALLTDSENFPVRHFNLTGLRFVPGTTGPSLIQGNVVHDLGNDRRENIAIRMQVDDRPDLTARARELSDAVSGLGQNGLTAPQRKDIEDTIRRLWLAPGLDAARTPPREGEQPPIVAAINAGLQAANSPLRVRFARQENPAVRSWLPGAQDWLIVTNAEGAEQGPWIYVGELSRAQRDQMEARVLVPGGAGDGGNGGNEGNWWTNLPLELRWGLAITGTGSALTLQYLLMRRLIPYLAREGARGIGRGLSGAASYLWNRRRPGAPTTDAPAAGQEFVEPTDVYSRSHIDLPGATIDARQRELETRLERLRETFRNNALLSRDVLVDFQSEARMFADQLREAQTGGTVTTAEQRATRFQEFLRAWARNQTGLTAEQRALFENIRISTDVHSFEGSALSTATVSTSGETRTIHLVLPANLLSGNMTALQINEVLGTVYDACFRADATRQLTGENANNPDRLREIRQGGNLLAYFLEHSMDHTLHLGEEAHQARIHFNASRAGLHAQHVSIEFRGGTMVVRQVGGAELTAEQVHQLEDRMLRDEVQRLERRIAETTGTERDALDLRRRQLVELQRRLASPTEGEAARRLLHEHLRARYDHHRGRTGGSRVAWGMIIDEALALTLRTMLP